MGLIDPAGDAPLDRVREVRDGLRAEVEEMRELLADVPGVEAGRAARARTARDLVEDVLALTAADAGGATRARLVAEANLLYDVVLVAAEYYKLFVRPPTPERPRGRI